MKKRMLIFTIGLMLGVAVTGCENKESAESSLESLIESTVETEEETEVQRPIQTPAPGEDGCGLRKPPEMIPSTGGDGCVPTPPYMATEKELDFGEPMNQETYPSPEWVGAPKSPEMMKEEAKKETIFGTVDQESEYIIKAEGDEWIDDCELSKLPEAPYKKNLDEIIGDDLEIGYGFLWNWEDQDDEYYRKWIDCGMYYKVKDVDIVSFYDSEFGGMDFDIIAHFDELYIMKEGTFNHSGDIYTDFNDWLKIYNYNPPRLGLTFDEKGYVVGCFDVFAS